jgi:hypothetical protein
MKPVNSFTRMEPVGSCGDTEAEAPVEIELENPIV